MKSVRLFFLLSLAIYLGLFTVFFFILIPSKTEISSKRYYIEEDEFSNEAVERDKYFFMILRDPATNLIPRHIREKELAFAKKLELKNKLLKLSSTSSLQWKEAGPVDVGGRTRALAVDVISSNTIIAGGVSGGIWKSTDNGSTWKMKSRADQLLSVTSVAQDTRTGHTDTWYFCGGEYNGSANDRGYTAYFTGNGIYKSTDNGESWNVLPNTLSADVAQFDSPFDYVSKIIVNPVSGSVFIASNAYGILRSKDGGANFSINLGGPNEHVYSDIEASSNGTLIAGISSAFQGITPSHEPGIYKSTDDGDSWDKITPDNFPSPNFRTVLAIPPSNENAVYVLTNTGNQDQNKHDILKFYKINTANKTAEDRSDNLPDFTNLGQSYNKGFLETQGNYNMTLSVKPDDENFILIAGTSIFRSTDGFTTKPSDPVQDWIGGYNPTTFFYPNFHPDIHSFAFDPDNPKKMWWGNDGGLAYTSDITNNSYQDLFPWENKNNGYDITQYYMIAISKDANDDRLMGGCQDNGTPFYRSDGNSTTPHVDVSLGDGAFSYLGSDYAYAETQNGNLMRLHYDQSGNVLPAYVGNNPYSIITPIDAANQLFVNPFTVDPADENILFYLAGPDIWRNDQLGSIPDGIYKTDLGWTKLSNLSAPQGYLMSAISISNSPAHVLYYAESGNDKPKIFRLDNANTASGGAVDISIPDAVQGAYIHHIAINPNNADEIIVVMSNYNIIGLYYSANGGQSYTAVEGNLQGSQQNPGPSMRCASILPSNSGTIYFAATSIGLFSTNQLNGNNTQWIQEGTDVIGNVVSNYVVSRTSDGRVVAATHGRGAFIGLGNGGSSNPTLTLNAEQINIGVKPGLTGSTTFSISNTGSGSLNFSINSQGGPSKILPNLTKKNELLSLNKFNSNSPFRGLLKKNYNSNELNLIKGLSKISSEDVLILDDGDDFPGGFTGSGPDSYFYWRNDFNVTKDFSLEKVRWNMATEGETNNPVEITIEANTSIIFDTTVSADTGSTGKWNEFQLPQYTLNNLKFHNGDKFTIIIGANNSNYYFPAAFDETGKIPGNSYYGYYYNTVYGLFFSGWSNLNSFPGFEKAAWLIRAVGNSTTGTNQNPVAVASVNPNPAKMNSDVSFDGSNSYDNDGQVVSYLWDFGDGSTSTSAVISHQYTQAGNYNYNLKVTDNQGAQGQTSGQITIQAQTTSRFTITPSSGNIPAGANQLISVSFNAEGVAEGTYQAQLNINSNGGNKVLPVTILVSNTVDVKTAENIPKEFKLQQNYPNPFNPVTVISYSIAKLSFVTLKIYDIAGKEIKTLIQTNKAPGNYNITFNAKDLSSGIYFYRIQADNFIETKKFVLLK